MKKIAMYLPQFHRVPENDQWWGEGFTEWTAVKSAKCLFEGQDQPHKPLNDHYYDLLDKETMIWQSQLTSKYGIEGQCFYHYYFKDGRKILEKPAENLLQWKDIPMNFCFCWANETWARTWSKLSKRNTWAEIYEDNKNQDDNGVLLQQNYGREKEWKAHFEYLLDFFKDQRYLKTSDGRPLFLIYMPEDIGCLSDMIDNWKELSREHNIKEPYLIGLNCKRKIDGLDAVLVNGPSAYLENSKMTRKNGVKTFEYDDVCQQAYEYQKISGCKTYYGGFVNYDDTPRRGAQGTVITGGTPEKFYQFMMQLAEKNLKAENEYLFLNAWNEWGEGMYLEPDQKNGYQYLEKLALVSDDAISEKMKNQNVNQNHTQNQNCNQKNQNHNQNQNEVGNQVQLRKLSLDRDKFKSYYYLFDKWFTLREQGINIDQYLLQQNINTVAIYGCGPFGKHLAQELEESKIEVRYFIDQNQNLKHAKYEVKSLDEPMEKVDAVIVTPAFYFNEIRHELKKTFCCPILSIDLIIDELMGDM